MSVITSAITLYKDSAITPARNFIVDDIDTYLATLSKISISSFQYLRNDLRLTIKINKDQDYVEAIDTYNYNYLKAVQKGVSYYYFILRKTQIAQSTIALELLMDTANTFKWNTAFYPTQRTRVLREHKDRIQKFVESIDFTNLESASWAIGEAFPYSDGTTFVVNVEFSTDEGGDPVLTLVKAKYYDDGTHKRLYLFGLNVEEGIEILNDHDFTRIQIYLEDYSSLYASIVDLDDVGVSFSYNNVRKIDYYAEGINPVLYKEELGVLDNSNGVEWNLVYQNHSSGDDVAIDCFCLPSYGEIKVNIPSTNNLAYTDFEDGKHYLFMPFGNIYYSLTDNDSVDWPIRVSGGKLICKDVYRSGTTLKIRTVIYEGWIETGGVAKILKDPTIYSYKTITSLSFDNILGGLYYKATSIPNPVIAQRIEVNGTFNAIVDTSETLGTLQEIDRAEPKLVKIITIPYFPSTHTYNSVDNSIEVDSTWVFENSNYNSLQLNNLNTHFASTIESNVENPLDVFLLGSLIPSTTALRDDHYESKLFHSEFYQPKFVYDSFGFVFELEKIDEGVFNPSLYFTFEFVMTSTINSKFMFKFPEYVLKLSTQDYDNILPVARNNEAPIYNSSYITYLRTAYRYDLKTFGQREAKVLFGASADTLQNIGSTIESYYTGKGYGKASGAMNLITGIPTTIFNSINELNSNEWSMEAKIAQLKNQSVSVSGSDDLDLMENYAGNKAKLCLYKPSDRMYKLVADLFYYFGYNTNELKIPDLNTRYWFNYIQCELEITGVDKNISESIKEDLISRYASGITILHNHSGNWDFSQVKENWETSLL